MQDAPSIRMANQGIYINNIDKATEVVVYNLAGTMLYRNRIASGNFIPLNNGAYIVRAGQTVRKVVVR